MWESSRRHLADAGETYGEHFRFAAVVGLLAIGAGLACLIHAVIPALCQCTCSRTVADLQLLFRHRDRRREVQQRASGVLVFIMLLSLSAMVSALPIGAGGHAVPALGMALLAFCFPLAFLLGNRNLEPVLDD